MVKKQLVKGLVGTPLPGLGTPNVFQTPENFDNWDDKRKAQWTKNRNQFLAKQQRQQDLILSGRIGLAEQVRGKAKSIQLREQQQRSAYNLGVKLSKAEESQLQFQQDFIAQLGEISRYQTEQGQLTQQYLQQQYQLAQQQAQQQKSYQDRVLALQQQLLEEDRQAKLLAERRSKREEIQLQELAEQTALMQGVDQLRNTSRVLSRRYLGQVY